jgi:hypothetical protein
MNALPLRRPASTLDSAPEAQNFEEEVARWANYLGCVLSAIRYEETESVSHASAVQ